MRKLIFLIIAVVSGAIIYQMFIRKNDSVKRVEYAISSTAIKDLLANPRDYENKEVTISGEVTYSFNLGVKFYIVDDGTGRIYVITDRGVPDEGEIVKVKGRFNQRFKVAGKHVETIREK